MELKNVSRYSPDEMPYGDKVQYFQSEDGQDFYQSLNKFTKKYKLCVKPDSGIICSVAEDVSALYPAGFTIQETDTLPDGFDVSASGRWGFDGTNIIDLMTPEVVRNQKHAEINAWRDQQENGSTTFDWNSHKWDAGKASQDRLSPVLVVAKSGQLPDGFFWTDANNEDVPVTVDDLLAIDAGMTQVMVMQGFKIHERQRQMKKDIAGLTDVRDILNYSVGWPD
ncbi:DUF4376 domain-containing protein [Salmonella enterica]|uniref:DUF4376 domain-containing protein n=1 Tax=Salmonella enterica TaxID=28901 RepID=A0A749L0A4_SALER|nr:DUF4376 domain-containing protein [Salmonella enterica]EEF8367792.1 DUF4376 domain-containing protein [Salmonella enterica]EEI4530638.1 DUF4376 domain-containing protein [Salmonella enterica]EJP3910654.1 DUF4376 domain-containing protein [Salmonella enterica]HAF5754672.1 DUF4376 domain-containing protein [Salmonella enterica]